MLVPAALAWALLLQPAGASAEYNILVLVADDLGHAMIGTDGNPVVQTPHLDRLAASGVHFRNAFCPALSSIPCRASLLTGRTPHAHRTYGRYTALEDCETTLPELLRNRGYFTAALGNLTIDASGLYQGFAHMEAVRWPDPDARPQDRRIDASGLHGTYTGPPEEFPDYVITRRAMDLMTEHRDTPWCLWLAFHAAGRPNTPPPPWDSMYAPDTAAPPDSIRTTPEDTLQTGDAGGTTDEMDSATTAYYGEISLLDSHVGQLLEHVEQLGLTGQTLVVFAADQGTVSGARRGGSGDGWSFPDPLVRVPLILRLPEVLSGGVTVDALVELTDVAPTVLDLLGIAAPAGFHGRSLAPLARGTVEQVHDAVFAQSVGTGHAENDAVITMVRTRRFKLLYRSSGAYRLYDLVRNPDEQTDIAASSPAIAADLRDRLLQWFASTQGGISLPTP